MKTRGAHAFVNQLLVYTLVMIGGTGTIGLGTVWMRNQITATAAQNKKLEKGILDLRRHLDDVNAEVEEASNEATLKRLNAEWRLGLVSPENKAITFVTGDAGLMLAAKRNAPLRLDTFPILARYSRPEDR